MENKKEKMVELEIEIEPEAGLEHKQFRILITPTTISVQKWFDSGCPFCSRKEVKNWRNTAHTSMYECKWCRKTFFMSSVKKSQIGIEGLPGGDYPTVEGE